MADQQKLDFIITANVSDLTSNLKKAKGDFNEMKKAVQESLSGLPKGKNITDDLRNAQTQAENLIKTLRQAAKEGAGPVSSAGIKGDILAYKQSLLAAKPSNIEKEIAAADKAAAAASRSTDKFTGSLITERYALYDVSSTLKNASTALIGFFQASLQAQMAQEHAFSAVQRTNVGAAPEELDRVRKSLLELTTVIPKSFTELTQLAALGSQLGIPATALTQFTETVSKFSATTNVTVENAATAFGKLGNLLGITSAQYKNLGDAVAYVGVKAAASETDILSVTRQIAAIATSAGFTADQIVGLSSALASLGNAPEESRGVLVQTFGAISKAVSSGGEKLDAFAKLSGMTATDFAAKWGDKKGGAGEAFQAFLANLNQTKGTRSYVQTLDLLGLSGRRTEKVLTSLASSPKLVSQQFANAASAWSGSNKGFLDKAFATTVDDIIVKFELLQNAITNFSSASFGSSPLIAALGVILDTLKNVMNVLTTASQNPITAFVSTLTVAFVGLTGVLLGVAGAGALVLANVMAMKTAIDGLSASGIASGLTGFMTKLTGIGTLAAADAVALDATAVAATGVGVAAETGSVGVGILGVALRALPFVGLIAGAAALVGYLIEIGTKAQDAEAKTKKLAATPIDMPSTSKTYGSSYGYTTQMGSMGNMSMVPSKTAKDYAAAQKTVEQQTKKTTAEIKAEKEALAKTATETKAAISAALEYENSQIAVKESVFALGQSLKENKKSFDDNSASGRANMKSLIATIMELQTSSGGNNQQLVNDLSALKDALVKAGVTGVSAFAAINDAMAATGKTANGLGSMDFSKLLIDGLTKIKSTAGAVKTALEQLQEQLNKLFATTKARIGVQEALASLGKDLAAGGRSFTTLTEAGRTNLNNLMGLMDALAVNSKGNTKKFANDLTALRTAMKQAGVTSPAAIGMITKELTKLGVKGTATSASVKAMLKSISAAFQATLPTIAQMVSDLQTRLSNAFTIRYGAQNALDAITTGWQNMADAANQARLSIASTQAEINKMTADKGVLEYQLGIALKYGDTLRANEIRAELDKLNADIAAKQAEIANLQQQQSTALTGNTSGAIQNRQTMQDMIQKQQDYLLALAATGKYTKEQLIAEQAKLTNEFVDQATQLGFNREEVLKYADAFSIDFTSAVAKLPKTFDLKVNGAPAIAATNKTVAAINAALAKIKDKTVTVTINTVTNSAATPVIGTMPWLGFASGGVVVGPGSSTSDSIPARLSAGEYVMSAAAVQRYGVDFMNSMNNLQTRPAASYAAGAASAGGASGMVYLSPEDRQLLRAAIDRPVNLYADSTRIAQTANAGNVLLAQRGVK